MLDFKFLKVKENFAGFLGFFADGLRNFRAAFSRFFRWAWRRTVFPVPWDCRQNKKFGDTDCDTPYSLCKLVKIHTDLIFSSRL